mmetsp:Transcript_73909/g.165458  ORF Transcript_73909/g.165458 Transcript_73909/m.165458 type:complete len:280 (-) Transcript_73909:155-994(-)
MADSGTSSSTPDAFIGLAASGAAGPGPTALSRLWKAAEKSARKTSLLPLWKATVMGVAPSFPRLTSAPAAKRASTTPVLPLPAAASKGVVPSTTATSGSALASSSLFVPAASPLSAAWRSLVATPADLSKLAAFCGRGAGPAAPGAPGAPAVVGVAPAWGTLAAGAAACRAIPAGGASRCPTASDCETKAGPGSGGADFCPCGGAPATSRPPRGGKAGGGVASSTPSGIQAPQYSPKYCPSTKICTVRSSSKASVLVPLIRNLIVEDPDGHGSARTSNS